MIERDGTKYIVRVYGKNISDPKNIRTFNCHTLDAAWLIVDKHKRDSLVHKIEVCAILETFTITL
jgi:hypothetical protein